MNPIIGIRVSTSRMMTVHVPHTVRRSWRERWLSLPWRPWQSERVEHVSRPDPDLYVLRRNRDGTPEEIIGHPDTVEKLKGDFLIGDMK